jgi:hypothetical protein
MNPVEVLESNGWYNANKRITAVKIDDKWKLTFRDSGVVGSYLLNWVMEYLQKDYTLVKHSFINPPIPNFILVWSPDDKKEPIKQIHYMTLWLKESVKESLT